MRRVGDARLMGFGVVAGWLFERSGLKSSDPYGPLPFTFLVHATA